MPNQANTLSKTPFLKHLLLTSPNPRRRIYVLSRRIWSLGRGAYEQKAMCVCISPCNLTLHHATPPYAAFSTLWLFAFQQENSGIELSPGICCHMRVLQWFVCWKVGSQQGYSSSTFWMWVYTLFSIRFRVFFCVKWWGKCWLTCQQCALDILSNMIGFFI